MPRLVGRLGSGRPSIVSRFRSGVWVSASFCRATQCKRSLCCHAVSVRPSVRLSHSYILSKRVNISSKILACLSGAVGSVAICAAWLRWSASLDSRPRLAGSLCQVIAAYALRLNSRAGTEGSTVSSLICDRRLILGLETLSISRCLNHW